MNESLNEMLSSYCNAEMDNLKKSKLFFELKELVEELNYILACDIGKELDSPKSKDLYLGIEILDDKNEEIEIYDEGFLCASTLLISVDKKERYKFFPWQDDDFIDSLNWIIAQLKNLKTKTK